MKIDSMKIRNFGPVENLECEFNGEITRFVGVNGSGKTTILKAFIASINGISEKQSKGELLGERFRFIGKAGASADTEFTFYDDRDGSKFTIKNHLTKGSNNITIKKESGEDADLEWLKTFFNAALFSAKNFCSLNGREQARALGIDTSSFDAELKALKVEATGLNRDLKAFGELIAPEKVERVDIAALNAAEKKIREELNAKVLENRAHNTKLREDHRKAEIAEVERVQNFNSDQRVFSEILCRAKEAEDNLQSLGYEGKEVSAWIKTLKEPMPEIQTSEIPEPAYIPEMPDDAPLVAIQAHKDAAYETNKKADAYEAYLARVKAKEAKQAEIDANQEKQKVSIEARNAYMAGQDFGFKGLTTNEEGELILAGRPLNETYFSKGECELIVAKLHASRNPIFKVRFIDDFDNIDDENQEKIISELTKAGFQIITCEVARKDKMVKENMVFLRNCKIETEKDERESLI